MSDKPKPEDPDSDFIDSMQSLLEESLEDLILGCFGEKFPQDAENSKFVLASIYHVCGHLAANNRIPVPDLIGLMAHETLGAARCVSNEAVHAMMKQYGEVSSDPELPVVTPPPKDVN